MSSRQGRWRDKWVSRLLGLSVRDTTSGIQDSLSRIEETRERLEATLHRIESASEREASALRSIQEELVFVHRRFVVERERIRLQRDDMDHLQARLETMRKSAEYVKAFEESEPLISVRIPAYKKTEELVDVAIASVLRQSYDRFEIVVVNDGPNPITRDAIERLGDKRIRFFEFSKQSRYPDDPQSRWMVAGSPGMNRATELSQGLWIAPLDDDDEFSPDHLEKLLKLATERRVELAYGGLTQRHLVNGTERKVWSFPPAIGEFSLMSALYLKQLDFFRYDEQSWLVDEPGDWNLIRRMSAAGVSMAATEDIVGTINMVPYTAKE